MAKYVITVEGVEFPPDMPVFLLLAKDAIAPGAIYGYADDVEEESRNPGLSAERRAALLAHASSSRAIAEDMRAWQIHNPQLTKLPD